MMYVKHIVLIFSFLSIFINNLCCNDDTPIAVITKVKGSSVVIRRNSKIKPQPAAPIFVNDKILTFSSSYVELIFDVGITLRIEENTVFEVKTFFGESRYRKQRVNIGVKINSGSTLVDTKLLENIYELGSFVMVTPSAVACVRGTVFYLRVDDAQTTDVAVFDGELDCYTGVAEEDIEKIFFADEEDVGFYEIRKKVTVSKDKQVTVSSDFTISAVTDLSFDMIEFKKSVVENFIKQSKKNRENLDKWKKERVQWFRKQKEEFKNETYKYKKQFIEEFGIENKKYKK
ncbi:MAG: FecR family protein [Endomicrobia bacterium]|nr:FecR family protein [Endomicrobiia bacterium]